MKSAEKPVRIQRSRKKGSKLASPNGLPVVCVTRGTQFGNPFVVGGEGIPTAEAAVARYRDRVEHSPTLKLSIQTLLRGKNLACWCKKSEACHADVLLEIANQ